MYDDNFYSFPNRTLCDVFEEIRKLNEKRNYSYLGSLVEEAQHLANRMEAALSDKKDIKDWREKREDLKKEMKELYRERKRLKNEIDNLRSASGLNNDSK